MSTATASKHHPSTFERQSVFARPLVGVDGSDEVIEAARQAAILADGPSCCLGSTTSRRGSSRATGTCVPADFDRHQQIRATEALDRAASALGVSDDVTGMVVRGCPWDALIREAEQGRHTVVVVGSHGTSQARGIVAGSTLTSSCTRHPARSLSHGVARAARGASSSASTARPNRPVPLRSHTSWQTASTHTSAPSSITAAKPSTWISSTRSRAAWSRRPCMSRSAAWSGQRHRRPGRRRQPRTARLEGARFRQRTSRAPSAQLGARRPGGAMAASGRAGGNGK